MHLMKLNIPFFITSFANVGCSAVFLFFYSLGLVFISNFIFFLQLLQYFGTVHPNNIHLTLILSLLLFYNIDKRKSSCRWHPSGVRVHLRKCRQRGGKHADAWNAIRRKHHTEGGFCPSSSRNPRIATSTHGDELESR